MKIRKILTVLAVLIILAVIGGSALTWWNSQQTPTEGEAPQAEPDTTVPEPDWCPEVEFIAAPGTWESSADDDPFNPTAQPKSYMLSITKPLQAAYDINHVRVWTLPYTAQFRNVAALQEMSYDDSRNEGTARVKGELKFINETCPSTDFILSGFSQGAVIMGDIANEIGTGAFDIDPEKIRGIALIADGRRENGVGQNPGVEVSGIGAEIALQPANTLIQVVVPGATMRGPREGGFGTLTDRTFQICSPSDHICDTPHDIANAADRAVEMITHNAIHAQYATNPNVIPGTTASEWVVSWAQGLIDGS